MKKFLSILSLILIMFVFVSCVEDDDLEEGLSGDTAPEETGDTVPSDPTDTAPAETGDTDTADPTDTGDTAAPVDPADTGDTGSTPTDPGDTGSSQPDPGCQRNCDGKQCGPDGCGDICGICGEGTRCNMNSFQCECLPTCDNVTCNNDDGCGGKCKCSDNFKCNDETNLCECEPNCEEKQCGDDGCNGTCGTCTADEVCTKDQICKGCTTVTLPPIATAKNANNYIHFNTTAGAYEPNTGDTSKDDEYGFIFKSSAVKTGVAVDLSTSIDHCLGTDSTRDADFMCFFMLEDYKASSEPKRFLPKTGTVTVNSFSSSGPKINVDLSGIKMYEMVEEVHSALNKEYYFVPDGDCIVVKDTTLEK